MSSGPRTFPAFSPTVSAATSPIFSTAGSGHGSPQLALQRRFTCTLSQQQQQQARFLEASEEYTSAETSTLDDAATKSSSIGPPRGFSYRRVVWRCLGCIRSVQQFCSSRLRDGQDGSSARRTRHCGARTSSKASAHSNEFVNLGMRVIHPLDEATASRYCNNLVINSRYTLQNFIFKNLYEQFSRPLNFYFLLVAMLQFISVIAPVSPLSTLLPLLFAFTLTAVKEGYDDVKRHRQDFTYNNQQRTALDAAQNAWVSRRNADICVGDVLLLAEDDEIPCDVVVVGSTSSLYIRTDNLDGEIDLKPKEQVQWWTVAAEAGARQVHTLCPTPSLTEPPPPSSVAAAVAQLSLECPPPSAMVESFEGRADILQSAAATTPDSPEQRVMHVPLSHHHLLPQSCVLKNVAQVVCVAVYTGDDTKCGMNKRAPPVKWAQIDKDVSRYSIYIFLCQLLNAFIFGFLGYEANRNVHRHIWYLPQPANETGGSAIIYPLRFFLLTTVMIPVSFKFVVDVCKYYMANTVEWDSAMRHAVVGDTPRPVHANSLQRMLAAMPDSAGCKVKNSSILEDLGQIDYVLSDKTGTLTQNVMVVDSVTVSPGYHISVASLADTCVTVPEALTAGDASALSAIRLFAQMVALCNTVEVVRASRSLTEDDAYLSGAPEVVYHAASPDEVALCHGMRKLGVSLVARNERRATLRVYHRGAPPSRRLPRVTSTSSDEMWVIHHTFPFSSEKKSMGVLVEEPETARIWFVVKGADDRVLSMAASPLPSSTASSPAEMTDPPLNADCAAKLSLYAHRGLRTLLVGRKEISHEQLTRFLQAVEEANCLTEGRQARLDALRDQMEINIEILGITAIEDKLQEDVRETISDMLVAGIKVWMLTGDKMETAQQIGLSCGLYQAGDRVICIGEGSGGGCTGSSTAAVSSSAAQDWRRDLLEFPLEVLPPLTDSKGAMRRSLWRLSSWTKAAARACGKELETRVLRFDASEAATMSNTSLLTMQRNEEGGSATGATRAQEGCGDASNTAHRGGDPCTSQGRVSRETVRPAVLIVQGGAVLEAILHDSTVRERFALLSSRCRSVICARTTPSQKAAITHFVRHRGFMTLSVGDGGNDVAMLQEAHVGIGIAGREGQQAARAADFSITQFSDLRALLFVHGQQAYARTAYVIKYSFYKSMLISFIQLAYNVVGTHASGGTFWNSFSLTMWNGFYTLPQTILYCLDRCAPRVVLERNPYLYKLTRHAVDVDPAEFFVSFVLRGVLQSVFLLWLCTHIYGAAFVYAGSGGTASKDVTFSVAYTALMLSQLFTVWWESHSVTPLNVLMLIGMPLFYVYSTLVYSDRPALQYYGVFRRSLDNVGILAAVGVAAALVVPSLIYFTVLAVLHPNPRDTLRRAEVKRQRLLLGEKDHRQGQSRWVRWFHAVPESPSITCSRAAATLRSEGDARDDLI
ncbi:putative phospholipid-translocating P-type ATPase (flippase) [Leptomonas pyrrhocoris]|uniref:Putative phospholipid-translocating P-type ATPase (Flippase) n=1 Tax=Leptomonas pyrrhocoris TaxID=157538 RepID=A0A0N0DXW5_LEPPY|nr:putative phospholipid-translocating P-type ATPase (flippase) [Leptomonas pyrrhocoris]KPA83282.1 putative phospholipid-translocating P-type ATPase (flippase) [Leptomonas pyrrhocoris]|eukprot:XP_015661721.1 putative phospholipid-translocating P-type ATPase (flippase) [Leptomonas pyrrhocoris]